VRSPGGNGGGSGFVIARRPYPLGRAHRYAFTAVGRFDVDTRVPGVALIALLGEHELYGAPKLQQQIESLVAKDLSVVIDLTEAVFLDSSIVGVLLKAQKLAAENGLDYRVVLSASTGEPVRRMFEITGLHEILPIIERDTALPRSSSAPVSSPGSRFSIGGSTSPP
jgi:anti-anti-sigma factor